MKRITRAINDEFVDEGTRESLWTLIETHILIELENNGRDGNGLFDYVERLWIFEVFLNLGLGNFWK